MLPGDNAEGWEVEPQQRMPVSYSINSFTSTWYPADSPEGRRTPPLRLAQLARPADVIIISETNWGVVDIEPDNLWNDTCPAIFAHSAGKMGNFIYYDGHAKSRKWLQTLYPLSQNQWELVPNPDPNNRVLTSPFYQYAAPDGPAAKEFQKPACLAYQ